MDIERELEMLIDKHKGKQVVLGEIRLDWFAEDCLKEIRRLKSAIARQSATTEDVQMAIGDLLDMKEHWCADSTDNDAISIDLAITALQAYRKPSAIKWTGDNLREVISMTGWNESASSKWTWEEYEQVVKEKGLKIFTPDGSVIADIGSWIIRDGNDCFVLQAYQPTTRKDRMVEEVQAQQDYQPWVSVSERLPESGKPVLVTYVGHNDGKPYSDGVATWRFEENDYKGGWVWELDGCEVNVEITHWKPIPEPPKGE